MDTLIYDFKGIPYASQKEMCGAYGVSPETYRFRISKGMSQKEALTTKIKSKSIKDHTGKTFPNVTALCKYWGITRGVYKGRLKLGWNLEQILTTPVSKKEQSDLPTTDHTGQTFSTFKDMCKHWKINPSTVKSRLDAGHSLQNSLESFSLVKQKIQDHLGNTFESISDMCDYWNISTSKYMRGLEKNQTLEEILTINHNEHQYDDTLGHIFPDSISICKYYNITKDQFHKRLKSNKSMIETIGVIPFINSSTKETTIYPNYIVQEHLSENYFLCTICEHDIIRSYDEIIMDAQKYYKQNT